MTTRPSRVPRFLRRLLALPRVVRGVVAAVARRGRPSAWTPAALRRRPALDPLEARAYPGSLLSVVDALPPLLRTAAVGGYVPLEPLPSTTTARRTDTAAVDPLLFFALSGAARVSVTAAPAAGGATSAGATGPDPAGEWAPWLAPMWVPLGGGGNSSGSSTTGDEGDAGGTTGGTGGGSAPAGGEGGGSGAGDATWSASSGSGTGAGGTADPGAGAGDPEAPAVPTFRGLTEADFGAAPFTLYSGVTLDGLSTFAADVTGSAWTTETVAATTRAAGVDAAGVAYAADTTFTAALTVTTALTADGWRYEEAYAYAADVVTTPAGGAAVERHEESGYTLVATGSAAGTAFTLDLYLTGDEAGGDPADPAAPPGWAGDRDYARTISSQADGATGAVSGSEAARGGWASASSGSGAYGPGDGRAAGVTGWTVRTWLSYETTATLARDAAGVVTRTGTGWATEGASAHEWYAGSGSVAESGGSGSGSGWSSAGTITESGDRQWSEARTTRTALAADGRWVASGGSGSGSASESSDWSYAGAGTFWYAVPGGKVTGSSTAGVSTHAGWSATYTVQGAAGGPDGGLAWTHDGTGTSNHSSQDTSSYTAGGTFTTPDAGSGSGSGGSSSGSITASGSAASSFGVTTTSKLAADGSWVGVGGTGSGSASDSSTSSYTAAGTFWYDVPGGKVTGSSTASGSTTESASSAFDLAGAPGGPDGGLVWTHDGAAVATVSTEDSSAYAAAGTYADESGSGSGGGWAFGGTVSASGASDSAFAVTTVSKLAADGSGWVGVGGTGSGSASDTSDWSYTGAGTFSSDDAGAQVTGSSTASGSAHAGSSATFSLRAGGGGGTSAWAEKWLAAVPGVDGVPDQEPPGPAAGGTGELTWTHDGTATAEHSSQDAFGYSVAGTFESSGDGSGSGESSAASGSFAASGSSASSFAAVSVSELAADGTAWAETAGAVSGSHTDASDSSYAATGTFSSDTPDSQVSGSFTAGGSAHAGSTVSYAARFGDATAAAPVGAAVTVEIPEELGLKIVEQAGGQSGPPAWTHAGTATIDHNTSDASSYTAAGTFTSDGGSGSGTGSSSASGSFAASGSSASSLAAVSVSELAADGTAWAETAGAVSGSHTDTSDSAYDVAGSFQSATPGGQVTGTWAASEATHTGAAVTFAGHFGTAWGVSVVTKGVAIPPEYAALIEGRKVLAQESGGGSPPAWTYAGTATLNHSTESASSHAVGGSYGGEADGGSYAGSFTDGGSSASEFAVSATSALAADGSTWSWVGGSGSGLATAAAATAYTGGGTFASATSGGQVTGSWDSSGTTEYDMLATYSVDGSPGGPGGELVWTPAGVATVGATAESGTVYDLAGTYASGWVTGTVTGGGVSHSSAGMHATYLLGANGWGLSSGVGQSLSTADDTSSYAGGGSHATATTTAGGGHTRTESVAESATESGTWNRNVVAATGSSVSGGEWVTTGTSTATEAGDGARHYDRTATVAEAFASAAAWSDDAAGTSGSSSSSSSSQSTDTVTQDEDWAFTAVTTAKLSAGAVSVTADWDADGSSGWTRSYQASGQSASESSSTGPTTTASSASQGSFAQSVTEASDTAWSASYGVSVGADGARSVSGGGSGTTTAAGNAASQSAGSGWSASTTTGPGYSRSDDSSWTSSTTSADHYAYHGGWTTAANPDGTTTSTSSGSNHMTGSSSGSSGGGWSWSETYAPSGGSGSGSGGGTASDSDSWANTWSTSYDETSTSPGFYSGAYYGSGAAGQGYGGSGWPGGSLGGAPLFDADVWGAGSGSGSAGSGAGSSGGSASSGSGSAGGSGTGSGSGTAASGSGSAGGSGTSPTGSGSGSAGSGTGAVSGTSSTGMGSGAGSAAGSGAGSGGGAAGSRTGTAGGSGAGSGTGGTASGSGSATSGNGTGTAGPEEVLAFRYERTASDGSAFVYVKTATGATAVATDQLSHTTTFVYDDRGLLLTLTDPSGNVTSWTYDDLGNTLSETNPLGTRTFAYDAQDRLVEATDRNGRVREFDYDAAGRLTAETWLDAAGQAAHTIAYTYDGSGRLASASDAQSQTTYTYDAAGFLDTVTTTGTAVGGAVVVDYAANPDGSIASATVVVNGVVDHVEGYEYDAAGRLIRVTQHGVAGGNAVSEKRVDFTYHEGRKFATITRYADLAGTQLVSASTFAYTGRGQLEALTHARGATVFAAYAWTYTDAGLVASFATAGNTAAYSYDATGQLIGVDNSALADQTYGYDASGNRSGGDYATAAGNVMTAGAGWTYEYDAEGNRTRKVNAATGEAVEYRWDYRNRLVGVDVKGASGQVVRSVGFAYDALNQRIAKVVADGSGAVVSEEHYVLVARDLTPSWAAGGVASQADLHDLAAVLDGTGQVVERYVYGAGVDQVLAVETAAGTRWLLDDALGSVRAEVAYDAGTGQAAVVREVDYDAFGNVVADSAPGLGSRFGYTGREVDAEAGLQFNRARYYDPATGRWVSQDPKGFAAGDHNLYRYVGNAPTTYADPSGLEESAIEEIGTIVIYVCNNPFSALGNWYSGIGEGANDMFVQPLYRTGQFAVDVPQALDPAYQPKNKAFREYLNGERSWAGATFNLTLDGTSVIPAGQGVNRAARGLRGLAAGRGTVAKSGQPFAETIGVELDAPLDVAGSIRPKPGYFDVAAHGNPDGIIVRLPKSERFPEGLKVAVSAEEAASIIRTMPGYKEGMPVRLIVCDTAVPGSGGVLPFGSRLADFLRSPVLAPTKKVWPQPDGSLKVMAGKFVDGRWVPMRHVKGDWVHFDGPNHEYWIPPTLP